MKYHTRDEGNYTIIALTGDVDLNYSPRAREQILQQLSDRRHVLVDLSGVAYIDSSGIASLIEGLQYAKNNHLSFGLVGVSPAAHQVIQLARLDRVFKIYETVEDALTN
jgi:anti-sigma B factor antagonist